MLVVGCVLFDVLCCVLFVERCVLSVVCLLFVVRCVLLVVCCVSFVVFRVLVRCLLFVDWC